MPIAAIPTSTQIKKRERFPIYENGRIDGGRGFRTNGKVLRIGRNTFYNQKNKILMKIFEFKRSRIGIIAEFCGILRNSVELRVDFPTKGRRRSVHSRYNLPKKRRWM
jgi:hypothetical protein